MADNFTECGVEFQDVWGPQVSNCLDNFDFTLLFEESILFILPVGIAGVLCSLRATYLLKKDVVVERRPLYFFKMILWASLGLFQLLHITVATTLGSSTTRTTYPAICVGFVGTVIFAALSHLEYFRSLRPSTFLCVYIFGTLPMDAARARTLYNMPDNGSIWAVFLGFVVAKSLLLVAEAKEKRSLLRPVQRDQPPEVTAGIFNRVWFWWFNPLLLRGYKHELQVDDLFVVDDEVGFRRFEDDMEHKWTIADQKKSNALLWVLLSVYKVPFLSGILPRLCLMGLNFSQPFLIRSVVVRMSSPEPEGTDSIGHSLIVAYGLVYFGIAIVGTMMQHKTYRTLTMVRAGIISLIYDHTLRLNSGSASESTSLTLINADTERVTSGMRNMHEMWASFIEIGIALFLLERQVGVATAAGVGVIVGCLVMTGQVGKHLGQRQTTWLEAIQKRITTTVSALDAVKGMKMTGSSSTISEVIMNLRANDIKLSRKFRELLIVLVSMSYISAQLTPVVTFATYSLLANARNTVPLTAATAFTSLTIFALLGQAVAGWIDATMGVAMATASLERIREYLASGVRVDFREVVPAPTASGMHKRYSSRANRSVSHRRSRPSREPSQATRASSRVSRGHSRLPIIRSPSQANQPSLAMFSFHDFFLQERDLPTLNPSERIKDAVITVRDCSAGWTEGSTPVLKDMNFSVNRGDLAIVIGPVGCGKSTLLRVVLGEVPEITGKVVVQQVEAAFSAQTPWLSNASIRDNIVGQSRYHPRWYHKVCRACALDLDFNRFEDGDRTLIGSRGITLSGGQKARVALARTVYSDRDISILDDAFCGLDPKTEQMVFGSLLGFDGLLRGRHKTTILATNSVRNVSLADLIIVLDKSGAVVEQGSYSELRQAGGYFQSLETSQNESSSVNLLEHESPVDSIAAAKLFATVGDDSRRTGDLTIYNYYFNTIGWVSWGVFVVLVAGFVFTTIFPQVWIQKWTDANARVPHSRLGYYIGIYAMLGGASVVTFMFACWHFMINIVPKQAARFHAVLLRAVISAPMRFFTTTDVGETSNRFSQDLELIDMELPMALIGVTVTLLSCFGQAGVIIYGSHETAGAIPGLMVVLYLVQIFYLRTSRQLRVLDIEAKAPLLSHFIETINGFVAIRTLGWTEDYKARAKQLLERSQRPFYLLNSAQRWLNLTLDTVVAFLAVILVSIGLTTRNSSGSMIGLALVNIVGFSISLKSLIYNWTNLEVSMGAIARVRHFTGSIESENLPGEDGIPPGNWPANGHVRFDNVSASYDKNSKLVVDKVMLDIKPRTKVAICGRTGSGKSSLVSALLRLLDLRSGKIVVDGVALSTIPRQKVRESLITLPQDPFFFHGTVRHNLDISQQKTDQELWDAIDSVKLSWVLEKKGGLDAVMSTDLLSHGQRQLLALARALLSPGRILVMDEATTSLDQKTEQKMLEIIRSRFADHTIICIAHRLQTIMDFDEVIVLDEGRIIERGEPGVLALEPSVFAVMLRAATGQDEDEDEFHSNSDDSGDESVHRPSISSPVDADGMESDVGLPWSMWRSGGSNRDSGGSIPLEPLLLRAAWLDSHYHTDQRERDGVDGQM